MKLADVIAEARRMDEAATKGPWDAAKVATLDYGDGFVASVPGREGDLLCEYAISAASCSHVPAETGQHDAAFIAFARTALPRLARVAEAAATMRNNIAELTQFGCQPSNADIVDELERFDAAVRGEEETNGQP